MGNTAEQILLDKKINKILSDRRIRRKNESKVFASTGKRPGDSQRTTEIKNLRAQLCRARGEAFAMKSMMREQNGPMPKMTDFYLGSKHGRMQNRIF